jgi:hypothetical protein
LHSPLANDAVGTKAIINAIRNFIVSLQRLEAAKVTDRLLATYVSSDRKVLDFDGFKAALVKALSDAYEQGLQDGLVTRTIGPNA